MRIDEAKGKVFGIKEAKKVFEENQSVTLREKLRKIKQEKGNNIADESVRQEIIAILMQLEKCSKLNADEAKLK